MKLVFCAVVSPDVEKYVDLLNDVSTANCERAVSCDVAKLFFNLIQFTNDENLPSIDALILDAVKSFVSATTDEEETVLKLVIISSFFVISALYGMCTY